MKRTSSMASIVLCAVVVAAGGYTFARSWMMNAPAQAVAEVPRVINDHGPGVRIKPVKSLYRGDFLSIEASPVAGWLRVAGEAEITDFQEGANYFWMVRVVPAEGYQAGRYSDAAFEMIYLDQAFQVIPEQRANPEFDDLVIPSVPIGKYCVELYLIRLAPGVAPKDITDNEQLWSYAITGGSTPVHL